MEPEAHVHAVAEQPPRDGARHRHLDRHRAANFCVRSRRSSRGTAWPTTSRQLAGNYWRSGNPLASIDLTAGRIVCVVRGIGLALGRYCITPTLKANLIGIDVPNDPRHRRASAGRGLHAGSGTFDRLAHRRGRGRGFHCRAELRADVMTTRRRTLRHARGVLQRLPGGSHATGPAGRSYSPSPHASPGTGSAATTAGVLLARPGGIAVRQPVSALSA
jgi:hypothetical protein